MDRLLQAAHIALLLAAAGLCVFLGWFLWETLQIATTEAHQVTVTLQKAQAASDQLTVTLRTINRPCGKGPCGTLADIGKTLHTVRLTAGQIEIAANHEDKRIGFMDAQEVQIAGDTHALLVKGGVDLDTLNTTIHGVQPVESGVSDEVADLRRATEALTALESDPNLTEMAKNLNAASRNANDALLHVSGTTADVQQAVHAYLHPTLAQRIWHAVANTGVEVGKFFF